MTKDEAIAIIESSYPADDVITGSIGQALLNEARDLAGVRYDWREENITVLRYYAQLCKKVKGTETNETKRNTK